MFKPQRITPPAAPLISTADAHAHCRVDHDDENDVLDACVADATSYLDGWSGVMGRCLINQTWRQDFARWGPAMRLPFPDVSSIASITYKDQDGVQQTVDAAMYEIAQDHLSAAVFFKTTFTIPALEFDVPAPISVTYVAGYGADADAVPGAIRRAALLLVGHYFENREAVTVGVTSSDLQMAVDALIAPHRRVGV